jgi:hypothetical protein
LYRTEPFGTGPLLTYVLLDGLLRAPGEVQLPDEERVRRQARMLMRAVEATPSERKRMS